MVKLKTWEDGMYRIKGLICRYLMGSPEGVRCSVAEELIRSLEDADIRLCMNKHHEACSYYLLALRRTVLNASDPDAAVRTL